jgi:hypothetical protein
LKTEKFFKNLYYDAEKSHNVEPNKKGSTEYTQYHSMYRLQTR